MALRRGIVGVLVGTTLLMADSVASAHSGGTDKFGCHVDSSTGTRHCHGEEGEPLQVVGAVEGGLEIGRGVWQNGLEQLGYFGSVYVQHDGSFLLMGGFAAYYGFGESATVAFVDLSAGLAILGNETFVAARTSGGLRIPVVYIRESWSYVYLKLGVFMEGILDGANAEPIGVDLIIGVAL
jgi:hypothetical protein